MRNLDKNKKKAIEKAAIHLINTMGLEGASMAKIAKRAKVSPATIYIYFENKEDMLIKLYFMVKKRFGIMLKKGFQQDMSIKEGAKLFFENIVRFFYEYPDDFMFMERFSGSPIINKVCDEITDKYFGSVIDFIERGKREKILKNVPIEIIFSFLVAPINTFIKRKGYRESQLTAEEIEVMFQMSWDALTL